MKYEKKKIIEQSFNEFVFGGEQMTLFLTNIGKVITDFALFLGVVGTVASLLSANGTMAITFTKFVIYFWVARGFLEMAYNVFADDLKQNGYNLLDQGFRPNEIYKKLDMLIKKIIDYAKDIKSIVK